MLSGSSETHPHSQRIVQTCVTHFLQWNIKAELFFKNVGCFFQLMEVNEAVKLQNVKVQHKNAIKWSVLLAYNNVACEEIIIP